MTVANAGGGDDREDKLVVRAGDGDDVISAAPASALVVLTELDGGAGADAVTGGDSVDILIGGDGDDQIDDNGGGDLVVLGAGDDRFAMNRGDGDDRSSATPGRRDGLHRLRRRRPGRPSRQRRLRALRRFRQSVDLGGVERVDVEALGGRDSAVVDDLTGTGLTQVNVDLGGELGTGTGDGAEDRITVAATPRDDDVRIAAEAGDVVVAGLATAVRVSHSEPGDELRVDAFGGADMISAGTGMAALIVLLLNGRRRRRQLERRRR